MLKIQIQSTYDRANQTPHAHLQNKLLGPGEVETRAKYTPGLNPPDKIARLIDKFGR